MDNSAFTKINMVIKVPFNLIINNQVIITTMPIIILIMAIKLTNVIKVAMKSHLSSNSF